MTSENGSKAGRKPKLLNRKKYIPFYLINMANQFSRGASRIYRGLFGVGVIEWRMLSVIAIKQEATANQICAAIDLDKGAASRSLKTLSERQLVAVYADRYDSRKRLISLTEKGVALYDEILKVALEREKQLMAGFSKQDKETVLALLKRMDANLVDANSRDYTTLVNMELVRQPTR